MLVNLSDRLKTVVISTPFSTPEPHRRQKGVTVVLLSTLYVICLFNLTLYCRPISGRDTLKTGKSAPEKCTLSLFLATKAVTLARFKIGNQMDFPAKYFIRTALVLVVCVCSTVGAASQSDKGSVEVTVEGMRKSTGRVYIALQNSAKIFASRDHYYLRESIDIGRGERVYTFNDIAPGRYAVALFHDENGNDDIDYNFLGIPKEGFGFSNNAMGVLSMPSFDKASFEVKQGEVTRQRIKMRYIL